MEEKLRQQEYCQVMTANSPDDLEQLISSAGDIGMILQGWVIDSNDKFVCLFYPVTEYAVGMRQASIARRIESSMRK